MPLHHPGKLLFIRLHFLSTDSGAMRMYRVGDSYWDRGRSFTSCSWSQNILKYPSVSIQNARKLSSQPHRAHRPPRTVLQECFNPHRGTDLLQAYISKRQNPS